MPDRFAIDHRDIAHLLELQILEILRGLAYKTAKDRSGFLFRRRWQDLL
jgi:hypothetical protein